MWRFAPYVKMDVLPQYYSIHLLKDWLCSRIDGDVNKTIILDSDTQSYKNLLTSVYVCEDGDRCPLSNVALSHYCEQKELVLNAIERILCKKGYGKNIITYGFCLMSPDPFAHSCGVNVESRYPNSCVNRLFYPAWETLLSRIGDTLMMYLLEHASLFLQVAPACLLQLTGTPIHNLPETALKENSKKARKIHKAKKGSKFEQKNGNRNTKQESTAADIDIDLEQQNSKHNELDPKEFSEESVSNVGNKGDSANQIALETGNEYGSYKQTIGEERKCVFLTGNKNIVSRTIEESCSIGETIKSNFACKGKKKRKYEDISENKFQEWKRKSEMYAKGSRQETHEHTSSTHDGITRLDVRNETGQAADAGSRENMYPRKRKLDEMFCTESEIEDCRQMDSEIKRRCFENESKRDVEDTSNTGCTQADETIDEIEAGETEHNINVANEDIKQRDFPKIRKKRRETKRKHLKISEERIKSKSSFCPFEYHFPLPRNSVLFSRSPRERLPKSVLLARLDSTPEGTLLLYKEIFCETNVFTVNKLQVRHPDPHEMRRAFNIPEEVLNLPKVADVPPQHSFRDSFQACNISTVNGHPSFWNDVTVIKLPGVYEQVESVEHYSIDKSCGNLRSCRKSENGSSQSILTKHENSDVLAGIDKAIPTLNKPVYCELKQDNFRSDGKHSGVEMRVKSWEKEALLAKRKFEILRGKNDELNHLTEGDKLHLNISAVGNGVKIDISNYGDRGEHRVSLEGNSPTPGNIIKSMIPVEGNSKSDSVINEQCGIQGDGLDGNQLNRKSGGTYTEYVSSHLETSRPEMSSGADKFTGVNTASTFRCERKEGDCNTEHQADVCSGVDTREGTHTVDIPMMVGVIPWLKQFIEKHRRCPYRALLNHHCPAVCKKTSLKTYHRKDRLGIKRRYGGFSVSKLLSNNHHHRKVYLFLRACIVKVMPVALVGKKHNFNILLKNVSKLVSLGKYDRLTLGQLMYGIKTTEVDWLTGTCCNSVRLHVLARLIVWVFSYVLVLLKTYFYITDTGFLRYRLVYYRQTTWNKLHSQGFKGLINRKILKTVSERKVLELLQSKNSLGVSLLRFLPKQQSLRPIINMGSSISVHSWQTQSVNKQILDLHSVLTYLKNRNPSIIGHGKLGTNDIYKAWKSFVQDWRRLDCPKLYYVKTDISNCYDSIRQNKLYDIMVDILKKEMNGEEFIIRKYFTVGMKDGNVYRKFQRDVTPMSEFNPDFSSFCTQKANKEGLNNVIFVDKVVYQHETCESLLKLLRSHLFNNLVKVGSHYCLQTSGISQGSVISTILCSFYYADMEKSLFNLLDGEFLLRIVDDYLYVTPSQEQAVTFLNTMIRGVPEYNCCTNKEKILTNFLFEDDDGILPIETTEWFPWCGLYFNTRTLEVSMDFTKYSGFRIKDTMTVELSKTPGKSLKDKILFSVRQKCHALFVDTSINSEKQMLSNLYQMFLLAVFKLHTHIQKLPSNQRAQNNTQYFLGVIREMVNVVAQLVNKYLLKYENGAATLSNSFSWLCMKACYVKMSRHHPMYKQLLKHLRKQLKHKESSLTIEEGDLLNAVVDPNIPKAFHHFLP